MIQFSINKEKRIVVAYSSDDIFLELNNLVMDILIRSGFPNFAEWPITNKLVKHIYDQKPIIGIAKCHPEEEFNEEKGKQIATQKYKKKIARLKKQVLRHLKKYVDRQYDKLYTMIDRRTM